jgi:hypothetical protein
MLKPALVNFYDLNVNQQIGVDLKKFHHISNLFAQLKEVHGTMKINSKR